MNREQKDIIYKKNQVQFGVNSFPKYYYCSGLSLENLTRKLKIKHGEASRIFVRFDHIVVKRLTDQLIVYLLVNHNSGRCANFLHEGKLDCAFYLFQWLMVVDENTRINICSHWLSNKPLSSFQFFFFMKLMLIVHYILF